MKITGKTLAVVIPLTMIVGIAVGSLTGWWRTESSKEPIRFAEGEFAGEANPADIRGSYSLQDVSNAFDVPVDVLAAAFLLEGEVTPGDVLVKEFEERFGIIGDREIGTDAMRLFVARYRGLPYEPEVDTGVFAPAVHLVEEVGNASAEEIADLRARTVGAPATGTATTVESETAAPAEEPESDDAYLVKGNTTFGELLTWGVSEDDVRALLDGRIGTRGEQVRTWCIDQEVSFSAIKEELQRLVDDAVQ